MGTSNCKLYIPKDIHIVNIVHKTGLLNEITWIYPVFFGESLIDFRIKFLSISAKCFIKLHEKYTGIQMLSTAKKISTKLLKSTLPYRNSEFPTIHDLEEWKVFPGIPYHVRTMWSFSSRKYYSTWPREKNKTKKTVYNINVYFDHHFPVLYECVYIIIKASNLYPWREINVSLAPNKVWHTIFCNKQRNHLTARNTLLIFAKL